MQHTRKEGRRVAMELVFTIHYSLSTILKRQSRVAARFPPHEEISRSDCRRRTFCGVRRPGTDGLFAGCPSLRQPGSLEPYGVTRSGERATSAQSARGPWLCVPVLRRVCPFEDERRSGSSTARSTFRWARRAERSARDAGDSPPKPNQKRPAPFAAEL